MLEHERLFQALAVPVITMTEDDVVVAVNAAAEALYGVPAAVHVGRPLDELFLVDGRPWSGHEGRAHLRQQGSWQGRVTHTLQTGRSLVIAWSLSRLSLAEGAAPLVVAIATDVTEYAAAEARAHHIVRCAPIGIAHVTGEVLVEVNDELCRMSGFQRDELLGQSARLLYASDAEFAAAAAHLQRQGGAGSKEACETHWQRKQGEVIDVLLGATPLEADAPATHLAFCAVDITEHRQTQRALRDKSVELDRFFSATLDLLCIADTDGYFRRLNPEWERTLGYRLDEMEGKPFLEFVHPDDVEQTRKRMAILAGQESVIGFTNRYRHKDGSYRWIEWRSFPAGKAVYAAARDVTVRIKNERALLESERLNRMIAEMASDYIFHLRVDAHGKSIMDYASASFTEITGRSLNQVRSPGSWGEFIYAEDLPKLTQALTAVVRERKPQELEVRSFVRGVLRWTHVYARPELDAEGRHTAGIIGAAKDITERKRLEAEQDRLQAQLQQAMKMEAIGRLAGGLAHDFNNLLTGITGNVDLALLDVEPHSPLAGMLGEALKAARSAATLTHQLLAFSRKQVIEPKVLNLNTLVADLKKMLERIIGEDVALHFTPASDLDLVRVDPGQFEQVIVNLGVNARDAMPSGGTLSITTTNVELDAAEAARHAPLVPGRYVLLAMSDTGTGIPPEVQAHVFEPFFTTKPQGRGTGLGLASIYGAVTQAGGTVEFATEIGKGTTFRIYVPATTETADAAGRDRHAVRLPGGSETVLLVEDEPIVRDLAHRLLLRLGYVVVTAGNGNEALRLAAEHKEPIDLLLTDIVMPGMSGRELAERLLPLHPEAKVLYSSGYTADVIGNHGILDDDVHFISKPYTPQALAEKVRDVLDKRPR